VPRSGAMQQRPPLCVVPATAVLGSAVCRRGGRRWRGRGAW
jgi:hypothetical protein